MRGDKMKMNWTRWAAVGAALAVLLPGCADMKKPNPCRNPNYVKALKDQAASFYGKGDYINAFKIIKDAEACKPKDSEVYYWMGLIYFQREKYYDAIDSYQKAIAINPKDMQSRMALGVAFLKLERWDEAITQFELAAHDDFFERPWEAYNDMGWAYLQKGDLAMAEVNFNQAIHLNPNYCIGYTNLGELYGKQDSHEKAIANYQKAISLCPTDYARPHLLLALEYGHFNYFNQACVELSKAAMVKGAPEAAKALEYMRMYNCQGVVSAPLGP
jgi:type IV pilus assembly protein PilF